MLVDSRTGALVVPNGTLGDRFGESGAGKWNLDLGDVVPALSLLDTRDDTALVDLPRFDLAEGRSRAPTRCARPARRRPDGHDGVRPAAGSVRRRPRGLPGEWPRGYDDVDGLYTPAWQEPITSVPAEAVARIAREFAQNAADTQGRSMIIVGAGTNHWYHSDTIYRCMLLLTTITGCQGRNGGGWAHYVGQEKARPITGWAQMAFGLDWVRPPRQMIQTAYWYMHTDQYRYDHYTADTMAGPTGTGLFDGMSTADQLALSTAARLDAVLPDVQPQPARPRRRGRGGGQPIGDYVVEQLKSGDLHFAVEDPDAPENWPRVLMMWRANLFGSSAKGNEYFLKHLLGTDSSVSASETAEGARPKDVLWREEAPEGKLDLLCTLDFRMTSSTIFSDVVLPAATWYEKHDINTTDMHPFIHSFNPAISPPWQTKTDWDIFQCHLGGVLALGAKHLGVRKDVVAAPLLHDTPEAMATPHGRVLDWKKGECEPVPGKTMPKLVVVERDYGAIFDKMGALGPLMEKLGTTQKGITYNVEREVDYLRHKNGAIRGGVADGRPSLKKDTHVAETIMALSGTTNGHLATQGFKTLEKRTGQLMHDLAAEHEGKQITFADTRAAPVPVITSPEWSGSESGGRRYSPSPSTSSGSSRGTRSPVASTSTSTTTGCRSSARACLSTGHRST